MRRIAPGLTLACLRRLGVGTVMDAVVRRRNVIRVSREITKTQECVKQRCDWDGPLTEEATYGVLILLCVNRG